MITNKLAIWHNNEVVDLFITSNAFDPSPYYGCPLVDCRFTKEEYKIRYGTYRGSHWIRIPYEDFPADFKMQLILLGIE